MSLTQLDVALKKLFLQLAWELSTRVLGIPAERVWVSVFEEDEDAFQLWRDKVRSLSL